jgi:YggT family protein
MNFLLFLIGLFFNIAFFVIIAQVAISWLLAFDVINAKSQQAQNLVALLHKLTDPVYSRLRRFIPVIGGIDLTPLVVMIGLSFAHGIIIRFLVSIFGGA